MASYKTHLQALYECSAKYSSLPILKLPVYDHEGQLCTWQPISYQQFTSDVEHFAAHLAGRLAADGVPLRSVVGLWSNGMSYVDILYIYAIARAGYIPQLFSLRLPNPDVIYELLEKANGRAMIYEPDLASMLSTCPCPAYSAVDLRSVEVDNTFLPPVPQPTGADDIVMIFHTSGSTSGRPKLLPCNYKWLDAMVRKSAKVSPPLRQTGQDVTVAMGSMCHIGQTFMFLASFQNGACTIQPKAVTFSTDELALMITRGGLNRLNEFPAFFAVHVRAAKQSPKLLALLRSLDEILYSGQPMSREDEEWAYAQGLKMRNLFGSTECGAMLLSIRGGGQANPPLRPIEGTSYAFMPIEDESDDAEEGAYSNANARLLELVILANSDDCPHVSMRAADGHYHTGDLFVEVGPGAYLSRGRGDDWIKSENALRCDTRAIEDNVRQTCGELIVECVVVGNGRPSPALFVEAAAGMAMDDAKLRREIIRRTRHFHSRRYLHERISNAKMVVVVPMGTLPRTATKGNVRRRAVEEMFTAELDAMFTCA
ncbi:acetyl-CoA synthetase-like protein [Lentinus tigrinus ALCF2SS1-7]|uniref:Acetyl-CoA synthetase-like protein n=1 Tax=Lentinus tigrinus ALCF2SS1-6 TaxID=1328759 RepID=A0A5C2RSQ2_9APHY|nr:acetyl-CoA synthetase-like protein [Lentinus tigrinus ALCF2SS1-6]RPD73897.1 acetyl-CoA synthetase-like protein [Lentinus tigrinus ALCF2SS1-7]